MSIIAIVAVAKNYAIGRGGKLPWHYPADLKFFKKTTTGHTIVMGLHTWQSIGRPLPNRLNIILSRSAQIEETQNVRLFRSREEVLEFAKTLDKDLFIIGGAKTYETFAYVIDKWLVTEVPDEVEDADTFMPGDFLDGFALREIRKLEDELQIKTYERM